MLTVILYSIIAAVLLAGIDAWRINRVKGQKANISHAVSAGLAGVVFVGVWWLTGAGISWHTLAMAGIYAACRGLVFDLALNLFRRLPVDYISQTTSSGIDQRLNRVVFWKRRALYLGVLGIVLFINYFL